MLEWQPFGQEALNGSWSVRPPESGVLECWGTSATQRRTLQEARLTRAITRLITSSLVCFAFLYNTTPGLVSPRTESLDIPHRPSHSQVYQS